MAYRIGQVILNNVDGSLFLNDSNGTSGITKTNNIFTNISNNGYNVSNLKHFAIQAPPGASFEIDGEEIWMGRSGTYEIDTDLVNVSDIRLLSKHLFIIDFRY